jgi:hypothetical protein
MDFCCEPEIAKDHTEVLARIGKTVAHLNECNRVADGEGVPAPMPVLQGWHPEDYVNGPIYEKGYKWPNLVGIGSVCRREVAGPDGIMAVIEALDEAVPTHVKFHLFGVKSQALKALIAFFPHRIQSMDSMAWNRGARWADFHAGRRRRNKDRDAAFMAGWYDKQTANVRNAKAQLTLNLNAN